MKKKILIILFAFFLLLGLLLFLAYYFFYSHTIKRPERLPNIPKSTNWVGGIDGGNWYQISKVLSKNTFKIKIYNGGGSGELLIDTIFILNHDCIIENIDSVNLIKGFNYFDGRKIGLLLPDIGK